MGGRRTAAAEVKLPLHQVPAPAFYIAVVPDMVGGRLSSHDRDLLGLAHSLAGSDGAVLAVVFNEHKESNFSTAGVDRLLVVEGEAFEGYAPEQLVQGLRAVDNQFTPRHWLLPDSRTGGGELGRRLGAALGERPATRVWQVKDGQCIGRAGAGQQDLQRAVPRLILAAAECAEPVSETRHEALPVELSTSVVRSLSRIEDLGSVAVDPATIAMAEAEFIISGGNGVRTGTCTAGHRSPWRHRRRLAGGGGRRLHAAQPPGGCYRHLGYRARVRGCGYLGCHPAPSGHRRLRQGSGDQHGPGLRHDQTGGPVGDWRQFGDSQGIDRGCGQLPQRRPARRGIRARA